MFLGGTPVSYYYKNEVSPHCKRRCPCKCRMCTYRKNCEDRSEISEVMILEKFQAKCFPLALRIHTAGLFIKNKGPNYVTAGINVHRGNEADDVASDDLLVHITLKFKPPRYFGGLHLTDLAQPVAPPNHSRAPVRLSCRDKLA